MSIKYPKRSAEAGIEPSVDSVADSYDSALAETINGLYKAEVIHRRGPWRSLEVVELATPFCMRMLAHGQDLNLQPNSPISFTGILIQDRYRLIRRGCITAASKPAFHAVIAKACA